MTDQLDSRFTIEDLAALMQGTAGVSVDPADLGQAAGSGFEAFGLDSLGLLGIIAELEARYGRSLPADAERCRTPEAFLAMVNETLQTGA